MREREREREKETGGKDRNGGSDTQLNMYECLGSPLVIENGVVSGCLMQFNVS